MYRLYAKKRFIFSMLLKNIDSVRLYFVKYIDLLTLKTPYIGNNLFQ